MTMIITKTDRLEAKKIITRFDVKKSNEDVFYDLCFTILAPQTTFKSNIKAVGALKRVEFYRNDIDIPLLQEIIRPTRFYRVKADRLLLAKRQFNRILAVIYSNKSSVEKRNALVKMVKGLGMKAASHLLRNMGCKDLAIIDTHVIKYLGCKPPKNTKDYLRIEEEFIKIAKHEKITSAELDAIVWKRYSDMDWDRFVY